MNDLRLEHLSPVWSRSETIIADHGEGVYLYDVDGRRYLDFTSGIGVTNTGHAHPRVVQAVQEQAAKILHAQVNIVYHEPLIRLTEELSSVVPAGLDAFFFSNSGAEAVEAAVKLARAATGRQNIIVFQGSFHGRTHAAMAMTTSKTVYRAGYQPLVSGIFVAPFPNAYMYGWDEETAVDFAIDELKRLLKTQTAPSETAAMVIEPVLGEGGYVPAPARFLQAVREICDEHGILLAADEVQSGFGRTGTWFAMEQSDVTPDILIMAKGIASGMPLSGIVAGRALMDRWPVGSHGGTYGGNAVSCAAAVATIQVLRDEGLIENSARDGRDTDGRAAPRAGRLPGHRRCARSRPDGRHRIHHAGRSAMGARAKAVIHACYQRDLLLLSCGYDGQVVRWIPPLVVNEAQVHEALAIFAEALAETE